jgi:hypothetical protein
MCPARNGVAGHNIPLLVEQMAHFRGFRVEVVRILGYAPQSGGRVRRY